MAHLGDKSTFAGSSERRWRERPMKIIRATLLLLTAAASASVLTGCGGASVAVPTTSFPVPLVEKLPLRMGIHLNDELLAYVHAEKLETAGDWSIDLGGAQQSMFTNLLTGMFDQIEFVANPESASTDLDGVLVPNIEEVQFSIPSQTRSDYYEVWIRYQFKLYSGDGQLLADWPLTAYGKANQRNYGMQTDQPGLQAAALAACRDAMAFFTVQFQGVPPVKDWLAAELGGQST
jgi:hypothetical protein